MAAEILGAIAGGAMNTLGSIITNKIGQEDNFRYGEWAADNAMARTQRLYNNIYSPSALLQQYQKAGLSPSMMFGGTPGQGGMQGPKGTGSQGPTATYYPVTMIEAMQAKLLAAEAKKTEAEADVIEGNNEQGMANIAKTWAEAGHADAAAAANRASAAGIELDNYVKNNTKDASIYTICEMADKAGYESTKMYHEARTAKLLADYNEETFDTNVAKARKEYESVIQSISESKSRVELNAQQRQKLRNDVLVSFDEVAQKWKDLDIKEKQTQSYSDWIEAQIPYIEKNLELKFKELGIKNREVWVRACTESLKAICIGAATASQLGKGSNQTPQVPKMGGEVAFPFN